MTNANSNNNNKSRQADGDYYDDDDDGIVFRGVAAAAAAIALSVGTPVPALAAFGQSTIELSNITYETIPCPKGKTTMTIGKASCLSVSADSNNPSKERVSNAVFTTKPPFTRLFLQAHLTTQHVLNGIQPNGV